MITTLLGRRGLFIVTPTFIHSCSRLCLTVFRFLKYEINDSRRTTYNHFGLTSQEKKKNVWGQPNYFLVGYQKISRRSFPIGWDSRILYMINAERMLNSVDPTDRPFPSYLKPIFKGSPGCHTLIWKELFIHRQIKLSHFYMKDCAATTLWYRGAEESSEIGPLSIESDL